MVYYQFVKFDEACTNNKNIVNPSRVNEKNIILNELYIGATDIRDYPPMYLKKVGITEKEAKESRKRGRAELSEDFQRSDVTTEKPRQRRRFNCKPDLESSLEVHSDEEKESKLKSEFNVNNENIDAVKTHNSNDV